MRLLTLLFLFLAVPVFAQISPENTRIPPAPQIIDSTGAVWTISGGLVHRNAYYWSIRASVVVYCKNTVYAFRDDGAWYANAVQGWLIQGVTDPCGGIVVVPPPPPPPFNPKGCDPATALTQTCRVNISWEDPVNPAGTTYLVQRQDGSGPWGDIGTAKEKLLFHTFTDTGNTLRSFRIFAEYSGQRSVPSEVVSWTTPAIAVLPSYPTVPPDTNITQQAAPIIWTLGAASAEFPGNYDILRNGQSVNGARGSKIALCQSRVYVLGRDKLWWLFTGGAWVQTKSAKLPCD